MAIYKVCDNELVQLEATTFADAGMRERNDLQRFLRSQIDVIAPDTLVLAEEFGEWEDSHRRLDLLGIDKDANLVVIELKRTEDGGHMELQAIRYAAMIAALTFDRAVDIYRRYLTALGSEGDPRERILEFLDWEEPDEDQFAQEVRIVLASAEFSKEITTAVLWLNELGLDIRCVRLRPCQDGERLLLDVQQVVPLPEAEEYQVRIRDKTRLERVARRDRERRAAFNFEMVGVPIGAELSFERDENVICRVVDGRTVEYSGQITSLSNAAQQALGVEYSVQGPIYWMYEGETLDERRRRLENEL